MATLKEIMGNLTRGDGHKVRARDWPEGEWFEPIFWAKGEWVGIDESGEYNVLNEEYSDKFFEIKKTKIIKMYSPIIDGYEKNYCSQGEWHTDKTNWAIKPEIKGWLEMEVEVEE